MKNEYTYRCRYSQEDKEFVGTVDEFPSLSWLAPTKQKALDGIHDVTEDVIAQMKASNEPIPVPHGN